MADQTNRKFWRALRRFILDAQDADPAPIDSNIGLVYDPKTNEVTAIRVSDVETRNNDGGSGGGTSYPP